MIKKWTIIEPIVTPAGAVVVLPGRGQPARFMEEVMKEVSLWRSVIAIAEPRDFQWYPAPNGPDDQEDAIEGLVHARKCIEEGITKLCKGWGFTRDKIGFFGFSAGSVMTLDVVAHSNKSYAGAIAVAGAILEPENLPKPKNKTPIIVQHNKDDECFKWEERYLPMKNALKKQGYDVTFIEDPEGGHQITRSEIHLARKFFAEKFGYIDDYEFED